MMNQKHGLAMGRIRAFYTYIDNAAIIESEIVENARRSPDWETRKISRKYTKK